MRKRMLVALAGLALPAVALAAQPVFIRIEGHSSPMREVVQVIHTANGPVRVRTWSWRGPNGAATVQVSESRGGHAAMPGWALAQMRAMQSQMQQMRLIQAALTQQFQAAPPMPVVFGPVLPGEAPPLPVRLLQPVIPLRLVPMRVIVLEPAPAARLAPHAVHAHAAHQKAPPQARHDGRWI